MKSEDLRRAEEKVEFENLGLPDHPTVRKAHALIRADEKKHNALFTNRTEMGAAIARILFETGASTDPDVLGAAILNQYAPLKGSKKEIDKLLDDDSFFDDDGKWDAMRAAGLADLREKFSERLVEIYLDTSPFGLSVEERNKKPVTDEMRLISAALNVYLLQSMQQRYLEKKKKQEGDFKGYTGPLLLQQIENDTKIVASLAKDMPHAGLKAHMEKAVADANKLMNAPSNTKIRKPGSPLIDQGW